MGTDMSFCKNLWVLNEMPICFVKSPLPNADNLEVHVFLEFIAVN